MRGVFLHLATLVTPFWSCSSQQKTASPLKPCCLNSKSWLVSLHWWSFPNSGRSTRLCGSNTEAFSTCEESLPTTPGTIFGGRSSGSTVYLPHHAPATGSTQTGKYGALEKLLIRSHSLSTAKRADKLLSLPSLGDGSAVEGGFLFLHIFLRQLLPRFAQPWPTLHVSLLVISVVWLKWQIDYFSLLGVFPFEECDWISCRWLQRTRTQRWWWDGDLCFFLQQVGRGARALSLHAQSRRRELPKPHYQQWALVNKLLFIKDFLSVRWISEEPPPSNWLAPFHPEVAAHKFGTRSGTVSVDTLLIGILW